MAKSSEHAGSDIDLMAVGELASNTRILAALQAAQSQLGRVNPSLYTQAEFAQRISEGRSFIMRGLEQSKIFVKGTEHDIARLSTIS